MSEQSERLKKIIENSGLSYVELERKTGIAKSSIQRYAAGTTKKIPIDAVKQISDAVGGSAAWVMGWTDAPEEAAPPLDSAPLPSNILPLPKTYKVPLLGNIACGEPILAVENIETQIDTPENVKCDFALRCKGDSMINARIFDGDIVYIRQQPSVENGEIAAVLVDGTETEATLKRVQTYDDHVVLEPENPMYKPLVYWGSDMNRVRILGKAVAFTSAVR